MLRFNHGRSRDFSLLTPIRRFASVRLAQNIRISIRWIPSEFNSSDRGSTEHDCAHDATKSLVDHLGSNDGQTFLVSHRWPSREPGSCEHIAFAASDGVAIERNLFPEALDTSNSLCAKLAGDENQEPEKTQPPHDRGQRESSPPQSSFNASGQGRRDADGASNFVSSSDEEKESAGRARVLQRRGRARVRELVKMAESMQEEAKRLSALETKSVTRKNLEVYATSVREFCDWSGLSAVRNVETLELDRLLTKFMNLFFSEGHRAWKGEKLLANVIFFFPTFSHVEGNRQAGTFRYLNGLGKASPSFPRRPLLAADWSALDVDMCRIGGTLAAVLTLVTQGCSSSYF